jgi:hypothetical protein
MTLHTFEREYCCTLVRLTDKEDLAERIYCVAAVETENFDRTLPHCRGRDGDAMVRHDFIGCSQRFAREVYAKAEELVAKLELPNKLKSMTRQRVRNMSSELQAHIAKRDLKPVEGIFRGTLTIYDIEDNEFLKHIDHAVLALEAEGA